MLVVQVGRILGPLRNRRSTDPRPGCFSFLNIIGSGMKGGVIEQNIDDMDPKLTALVAKQYPKLIVGVKLAHYSGFDWTPTERAVEAGRLANIPVMIDFRW